MNQKYKSIVITLKGLRLKGDDKSLELSKELDIKSNELASLGWRLISVFPSVISEGAVVKLLAVFEKKD